MNQSVIDQLAHRTGECMTHIGRALGSLPQRKRFAEYALGLLLPGERKSMEPIAARIDPEHARARFKTFQHFVSFPHSKLVAYQLARQLVRLVHDNPIQDTTLRKHACDSVRSTAVHTAEGAARWSRAYKSRVYVMARAECCEAVACYQVASDMVACTAAQLDAVQQLGKRVSDIHSRLVH